MKKLSFLTRTQLSRIHGLGGKRNTNRILERLDPYLNHFRDGYDTVYYLNSEGRSYVDAKKVMKKNPLVGHTLMRNEMYIFTGKPSYWRAEIKVGDSKETVICDALYKDGTVMKILEVDLTQKMSINRKKIQSYAGMNSRVKDFPIMVWLTSTEHRRKQLKKACSEAELPAEVYTIEDIQ